MPPNELERIGISRMAEREIDAFLSSQGVGVLGLPAEDGPYLVPISFGFDGRDALYFTFVSGAKSRKRDLSERSDCARFLVYRAPTPFSWQSVVLSGSVDPVPDPDLSDLDDVMDNAWHPEVFDVAVSDDSISVYRFDIETKAGRKQTGLPPGFEA
ncbi:pyridoxamine 5'-phosphate oxidase family protein [Halosimplex salinum]|uniref:pyridoxamine 5'-phosphate oxidase family protein n=1 Tax=Halosimplex salinum TaxID=1710538 RepID=UPI000F47EE91|nr:pyridoxamine 5'-phosphate oxidase family protein [Halosimplex salinum]